MCDLYGLHARDTDLIEDRKNMTHKPFIVRTLVILSCTFTTLQSEFNESLHSDFNAGGTIDFKGHIFAPSRVDSHSASGSVTLL